jgi:hypothetical protein
MGSGDVQVDPQEVLNYGNALVMDGGKALGNISTPIRGIVEDTMHGFSKAPGGGVAPLPEGISVQRMIARNLTEFQGFIKEVGDGLQAMQSAATAMAVVYATTDNDSKLGLDAIDFAYGDGGKPPSGFPKDGWSTIEAEQEKAAEASGGNTLAAYAMNNPAYLNESGAIQSKETLPGGATKYTMIDGSVLVVSYPYVGNPEWGGRGTTYSVYKDAKATQPTMSYSSGNGLDGNQNGIQTETRTSTGADGKTITSTTTITHLANGDIQVTTSNTTGDGHTTTDTSTVHPTTSDGTDSGNEPVVQMLEDTMQSKGVKDNWGDIGMS